MSPAPPVPGRVLAAALALALLPSPAAAQGGDFPRDARVDSVFAEWDRPDSPGCALGVYRDGRMVYARGYGMADLERRVPITPRTVFDVGSTSKQFAAASVLLLAQEGKLSLDDDVRRHVPELPAFARPITIRHLLHHTSGLRDYIALLILAGARTDDVTTAEDALSILARQEELNFEPGAEHLYSNSGYFLLSVIVERVAGRSLRDFARERIFEPLGMTRTHYLGSYDDVVPDRALAYEPRPGGGLRTDVSRWLQLGDGAVFTTVEELLHWDRNFYDPRVGGPEMVAGMETPGRLSDGTPLGYALGLMVGEYRGRRTVAHGGAWGGYRAELLRFPEQRFSVAALCNLGTIDPTVLAHRVADVYLADVLAPEAGARVPAAAPARAVRVPARELRRLEGTYRDPRLRTLRTVAFEDGRLYLVGGRRVELRPRGAREFEVIGAPGLTLAFEPAGGGAHVLRWTAAGREPVLLERVELVAPGPAELEAYAGSYSSEELGATYTFRVEDGALVLRRRGADPLPLRPTTADEFSAGAATLRFRRGPDRRATGFLLDLGAIRDLGFRRDGAAPHAP